MAVKWTTEDIIDLEAFLKTDQAESEASLAARDAGIFESIQGLSRHDPAPKEKILRWVRSRRSALNQTAATPGDQYRSARDTLILVSVFLAFVAGLGVAAMHLLYQDRPINVTIFFSVTVLWQIAVLLILMVFFLFHQAIRFEGVNVIAGLAGRLMLLIGDLRTASLNQLDGNQRATLSAIWGEIRQRKTIYGSILKWPILMMIQTAAIAFNVGLLVATLGLLAVSNRAFGWESTFSIGPDVMLEIVQVLSFPWSFLPNAHPTFQQIADSRIALHSASSYPVDALRSWWPFLCYSILFWGLAPRVLLLAAAAILQRRAMKRLEFNHADCNRLLRRMTQLVATGDAPPHLAEGRPATLHGISRQGMQTCTAIIPKEFGSSPDARREILHRLGRIPEEAFFVEVDCLEAEAELFANLQVSTTESIILVLEAGRPPVKAILSFLREVRKSSRPNKEIAVYLMTRNQDSFDYSGAWEKALAALGDPYINFTTIP